MSSGAKWLGLLIFIFHSMVVVLERVTSYYLVVLEHISFLLSMKAIEQIAIMLECVQPCIVRPHGAILKRGKCSAC